MIAVNTTGSATSGNSSVWRRMSAISPKTANATIETMVISGRLMAKSEMNMGVDPLALGVRYRAHPDRRPRRHASGGAEEDGVTGGETHADLDDLVGFIANADLDLDALDTAALDAHRD